MKKNIVSKQRLDGVVGGREASFVDLSNRIIDHDRLHQAQESLQESIMISNLLKEGVEKLAVFSKLIFGLWKDKQLKEIEELKKIKK